MRKEYIYIVGLIACIMAIIWGLAKLLTTEYAIQEAKINNNSIENIYGNNVTITTASQEEKVSPNCNFALKKYYDECSHFDYEESELPKELVNKTKQEVEDYYDDWEVEEFSEDELVLCKEIDGYCKEHFIIKLDGDVVNIYRLGTLR